MTIRDFLEKVAELWNLFLFSLAPIRDNFLDTKFVDIGFLITFILVISGVLIFIRSYSTWVSSWKNKTLRYLFNPYSILLYAIILLGIRIFIIMNCYGGTFNKLNPINHCF